MASGKGSGPRAGPEGQCVRASGKDGPQIVRSKGRRWTEEAEIVFLDCLAASCNVTLSADHAGFSREGIYRRRRNDPGFAERWQAALEQGYARIEMLLVRNASEALEGFAPDPESPIPPMTVKEAIDLLKFHPGSVAGEGRRPGWQARPRRLEEVRDSILRKLSAIEDSRRGDSGETA